MNNYFTLFFTRSFVWLLFATLLILFVVAPFYGILPLGNVNALGIMYTALGNIDCLAKMKLCTPCAFAGTPLGGYMPFGLPFAYISSFIELVTGISVVSAFNITCILFLFIGWSGVFQIIRILGGNRFFSFFGGFLFLLMPIVYAKSDYVFMMWGFVTLPFFIWLDLWYFQSKKLIFSLPVLFLSKVFLIFLEPYTFVMASIFTIVIMLYETFLAIKANSSLFRRVVKIILFVLTPLAAYLIYKNYIPGGANYSMMPMDFFRGQGIDLIAFFNRPLNLFAFKQFWNVSITNSKLFYTDGESVNHVYFGLGLMLVIPLLVFFRKSVRPHHWLFFSVGVITFILSLGPSLKINNQRNPSEITSNKNSFEFNDYLMPKESATISMPHSFIYKIAPFKYMRSVSRWLLPTILIFVVSMMILLTLLWHYNRWGKVLALLIIFWVIVEYTPNYKNRRLKIDYLTESFNKFNATALPDFNNVITPGDLVLFIQDGGLSNEYFSTYLCSSAKCTSYNVSIDKALELSIHHWPKPVYDVVSKPDNKAIINLLKSKLATVIVFPHFDMRWNSYSWPPDEGTRTRFSDFARQSIDESENIDFKKNEWFSFVRLKK
ncbi:MAG: hypothetical protein WCI71_07185 [Bacteroidota bacterium]